MNASQRIHRTNGKPGILEIPGDTHQASQPLPSCASRFQAMCPKSWIGWSAAAKGGDVQAMRLVLERVLPSLKPSEATQVIDLPTGSLADQGRGVLAAVAAGDLSTGQGAAMLGAIGTMAKLVETDELARRLAVLEARRGNT